MILHIDMDAFFASVEQLDNPALRGKCVLVGRDSGRGVVAAASYEARAFGVCSAMPVFQAKKRCPQAVFVAPRKGRYAEVSRRIMALLRTFSPVVEPVSIDEAYLDAAGCAALFGSPWDMGGRIKDCIRKDIGLTCSIGIAPNKFLAKIASDMKKPDGMFVVLPCDVAGFVKHLPVSKVPGVGEQTRQILARLSIRTLGDVAVHSQALLEQRLGKFGRRLFSLAAGVDSSPVMPHAPVKSVSCEQTLAADLYDKAMLRRYLLVQSEDVGRQLRKKHVRARTVVLKLKHADFRQVTRSATLAVPTLASEVIFKLAAALLDAYVMPGAVRLIGVGAAGLVSDQTPVQQGLFTDPVNRNTPWEKVDRAVDAIARKFGAASIRKGAMVASDREEDVFSQGR